MENYLLYIGKTAVATAVFFLAYRLLFQHQKQFIFNRIYLPFSLLISFLIPVMKFTSTKFIEYSATATTIHEVNYTGNNLGVVTQHVSTFNWMHYLFILYFLGVIFFLFFFIYGNYKAWRLIRSCVRKPFKDTEIWITQKDVHPFSFFNKIILSQKTLNHPNLDLIIDHENIHVQEKHTLDIVFTECLFILQWFNPFVWLLKDAIKNNLEFKTDHLLLRKYDEVEYQLTLVGLAHKKGIAPFLTAFNGSQLKNRIIMMKTETKVKHPIARQLFVLPIITLLIIGLSSKEVKTEIVYPKAELPETVNHQNPKEEEPFIQSTEVPVQSENTSDGQNQPILNSANDSIKKVNQQKPQTEKKDQELKGVIVKGKIISGESGYTLSGAMLVFTQNNRFLAGVSTDYQGEYAIRVKKDSGEFQAKCAGFIEQKIPWNGETELNIVLERDKNSGIPDKSVTEAKWRKMVKDAGIPEYPEGKEPILMIDGMETVDNINRILFDPELVKSIKFKQTSRVKNIKQTNKIENGFIEMDLNDPNWKNEDRKLFIIDGKEVFVRSIFLRTYIYPKQFKKVTILKKEEAVEKYGEKGKDGAQIITTKD